MNKMNKTVVIKFRRSVWNKWFTAWAIATAVVGFGSSLAAAQATNPPRANNAAIVKQDSRTHQEAAKSAAQSPAQTYFTDVVLVNQNGEKMRFYSDLLHDNVDFALKKLGHFVPDKQDHLNIFIIGNERTGLWKRRSAWRRATS